MFRLEVAANLANGELENVGQVAAFNRINGGAHIVGPGGSTDPAADGLWRGSNVSNQQVEDGLPYDVFKRPPAYVLPANATQLYAMWAQVSTPAGA